ncbi:hypothetical protein PR202_ga30533 [Eleusine coracana subsp. coracana]|uniref:Uncharacterized protein n=1 Tax=Eleusine coracana subsp. coracana TaxID=191504 RepID=A0AAV5DMK3_ELECO|nr:hypothetical protein PR202_ga30499 [Eleusine coracana subsp. coracana]GJN12269.1 hypothetical protein PR202_ga30533 [Eleusine coracana subsp. coracana]
MMTVAAVVEPTPSSCHGWLSSVVAFWTTAWVAKEGEDPAKLAAGEGCLKMANHTTDMVAPGIFQKLTEKGDVERHASNHQRAMANAARVERLVLALNGKRYEVASDNLDPSMTLLEFIRTRTPFRGPKLGCGEGASVPC